MRQRESKVRVGREREEEKERVEMVQGVKYEGKAEEGQA